MCIDNRSIYQITIKDKYPLPRFDDIIDDLGNAKFFSILDATSEYYQIPLNESDMEKTAFNWKKAHYDFKRRPFRLSNAPATYPRIINKILEKELRKCVIPYLDDIIVYSNSAKQHRRDSETILGKLKAHHLYLRKRNVSSSEQK